MDSPITALAPAPAPAPAPALALALAPAPAAAAKTQPQMTNSQSQQGASSCQAISTDRKLVDANHSLEQKPLDSRDTEPMDISPQHSSQQQIEELDEQYAAYMGMGFSSFSGAVRKEKNKIKQELSRFGGNKVPLKAQHGKINLQKRLALIEQLEQQDKQASEILMAYCKPELAYLISPDKLKLLQDLLSSEYSVLTTPSLRLLISRLKTPDELRKVIYNNPNLALGTLANMDEVAFKSQSQISPHVKFTAGDLEMGLNYTNISFQNTVFSDMQIRATFKNCNFSHADFSGSALLQCDFCEANLTGTCFAHCTIMNCDFYQATLTGGNLDSASITYQPKQGRCFSETITLLAQAIFEQSEKNNDYQRTASTLRSLAYALLESQQLEKAQAVYSKLAQGQQATTTDFVNIGQAYLNRINASGEEDMENRARLAAKTVDWLQKGWKETANNSSHLFSHRMLFVLAIQAISKTDSAYEWHPAMDHIKNSKSIMKDTSLLLSMAQLYAVKQEDNEAMQILRQLVKDPTHYNLVSLSEICKTISEIGLRNKKHLAEALLLLEVATKHCRDLSISRKSCSLKTHDFVVCWLYRIDLILVSKRSEEALELISAMGKYVPEAKEMLLGEKYEDSAAWKNGGSEFESLVLKIRTAVAPIGVTDIDQVNHDLKKLKSN